MAKMIDDGVEIWQMPSDTISVGVLKYATILDTSSSPKSLIVAR